MSGAVGNFGLNSMRRSKPSPKQKRSILGINPSKWPRPGMKFSVASDPTSILIIQLPMYAILILVGFGNTIGFHLDPNILIALVGIGAASMFPLSISLAIDRVRKRPSRY